MKQVLFISTAALTFACGGGSTNREVAAPGANPASTAQAPSATAADARGGDQSIVLLGCLQGPSSTGQAAGTSGARDRTGTTAGRGAATGAIGAVSSRARFTLVDAAAASIDSGGVGTNGAGGSGGPLVSGRGAYDLDGIPADAAAHVNKQVRVKGRIDSNPASIGGSLSAGNDAARGGSPSAGPERASEPGRRATPDVAGAGGGHGSTSRASGGAVETSVNRRLVVESIEVVSESCAQR
jgi:hypothetical protein